MSTPEEPQALQRFSEAQAREYDIEVAQDSPRDSPYEAPYDASYDLWTSARSKIRDMLIRSPNQPLEETEFDLHDLWDTIIRTAIITTADDPAQDRLVAEVVRVRELGSLGPNAMTADGEVWSGLPFLVGDITTACSGKLMPLKKQERLNLVAFTARLVAAGVRAPELGFCALSVLRETLKTPESASGKSFAELLPAAVAWFNFAGHRLAVFSGGNGHERLSGEEGTLTTVGQLAREAGILEPGFSTKRWRFWLQRLEKLSSYNDRMTREQLSSYNNRMTREQALAGKDSMDMWSEYFGLGVE